MPATSNFQVFDSTGAGMMADADYTANSERTNGSVTGIASSEVNNKALHQSTVIAAAIAQFLVNSGQSALDTQDPATLAAAIQTAIVGIITQTVPAVLSGTAAPTSDQGKDGDLYIQLQS